MDDRERKARLHAREMLARYVPATSKQISHKVWRARMEQLPLEHLNWFVREGDKLALEIWCERCRVARSEQATVDADVAALAFELVLDGVPRARSGPKPYDNLWRDLFLSIEVKLLIEDFGLEATRSDAVREKGTAVSACQIVSEEMPHGHSVSEEAMEAIWKKSAAKRVHDGKRPKPGPWEKFADRTRS